MSDSPPAVRRRSGWSLPPWLGAVVVTAALIAGAGRLQPKFLSAENLLNIAGNQAATGILAVGMVLVITAGGIDLSVGSLLALAGGVGILMVERAGGAGWPGWASTAAGAATMLVVGGIAGLANGVLIARGRLPAFIVTLAALLAFRSAAGWIADGGQFLPDPKPAAFVAVGRGWLVSGTDPSARRPGPTTAPALSRRRRSVRVGVRSLSPTTVPAGDPTAVTPTAVTSTAADAPGIPGPVPVRVPYEVVVWAAVVVGGMVVLNRTRLGRYAVAVGSNPRAARYSAVPVASVRVWVYVISGLLVGVAAFLEAARNEATISSGNTGLYYELFAIAAAVIGGTRMSGGVGSVFGSAVGAFLLGVIWNVIIQLQGVSLGRFGTLQINDKAQGVLTGAIIVVAALAQRGRAQD